MPYTVTVNPGPATLVGMTAYAEESEAREAAQLLVGELRIIATPGGYTENADPDWDQPCDRIGADADSVKLPDGSWIWVSHLGWDELYRETGERWRPVRGPEYNTKILEAFNADH